MVRAAAALKLVRGIFVRVVQSFYARRAGAAVAPADHLPGFAFSLSAASR